MTDRLAMIETIARACGWEVVESRSDGVKVDNEMGTNWFLPFDNEADWFRAFDAMGLWRCEIDRREWEDGDGWRCRIYKTMWESPRYESEDFDRLTAMGEALYQAARVKLGEVEG